jgi:hypothetical protein
LKFVLAVVGSGFGDCHPWVLLAFVEGSAVLLLVVRIASHY